MCLGNLGTVYPIEFTRVSGKGVNMKCSLTIIEQFV